MNGDSANRHQNGQRQHADSLRRPSTGPSAEPRQLLQIESDVKSTLGDKKQASSGWQSPCKRMNESKTEQMCCPEPPVADFLSTQPVFTDAQLWTFSSSGWLFVYFFGVIKALRDLKLNECVPAVGVPCDIVRACDFAVRVLVVLSSCCIRQCQGHITLAVAGTST